jgi:serine/threonine protein kinase
MALSQLVGQVLDEKYRIERELGKGGMGAVYLATHLGTDRLVALKVIAPQFMLNDEFVERFKREAKAAGRMRHPNVVDVTDFGSAQSERERVAYLVMEYLDGCSLGEVLAEESRLPIDWVIDIIEQACSAVDEAHKQGVIHRDLKPDNIWLEPNRRGGYTVKVLDFGLAKLADAALSNLPVGVFTTAAQSLAPQPLAPQPLAQPPASREASAQAHGLHESPTQFQMAEVREEEETRVLMNDPPEEAAEEEATRLLPPGAHEASTQLEPAPHTAGRITRGIHQATVEDHQVLDTEPADGLTRAGSILGTPLYMSPEQCRSEGLDARSDIYSLGVIAYQMLAGQPPFTGRTFDVIKLHIEAPPAPLREKRREVPKRMASLVMSCLAKDPAGRPATAAGFASALRASSEGTGTLLRKAFALYSEHFPPFFRLSLLAYTPVVILTAIFMVNEALMSGAVISPLAGKIIRVLVGLLLAFAGFVASSVINGVTIRFVTQLYVAPLRPLKLRTEFVALKKKLRPLLTTTFMVGCFSILRALLLIIPGVIYFLNSSLAAPVVMMENLKGRAAIRRSKDLVKRARGTVIAIILIQYLMPSIASALLVAAFGNSQIVVRVGAGADLPSKIESLIGTALNILFIPLLSTLTALLYLKVRQLGGETLKEALSEFEAEETPRRKWQQRMRERLHTPTHASR